MMRSLRILSWIGLFVVGMLLSACGGSSSSSTVTPIDETGPSPTVTTISGVAAAGAPLSGLVTLVDSQGTRLLRLINADGSFSFDIAELDLVPPFFLKAEGTAGSTRYALHSVVTVPGTANINPLTEAQVKIATGTDPAALFDDPTSVNNISIQDMESALNQAADALMEMLRPLLETWGVSSQLNPITQVGYVANGEGLDKLFDILNVVVSTDKVEITDRNGNDLASITIEADGVLVDAISNEKLGYISSVTTALDEIREFLPAFFTAMKEINNKFASDEINLDQAREQAGSFFAAGNWVNFGYTRGEEIEDFIGESDMLAAIKNVANARIVKENFREVDGVYLVDFFLILQLGEGAETIYPAYSWALVKDGDSWKITGNGFYARITDTLWFSASRNITSTQVHDVVVARFDPEDRQRVFNLATITGPGLPEVGITFVTQQDDDYMHFQDQTLRACAIDAITCPALYQLYNSYQLTDQVIDTMEQVNTYTITYKFVDTSIDDEVHKINAVRPLPLSELNDDHFPEIHNLTDLTKTWAIENLIGSQFTYQYSTPTAFDPVIAEFSVDFGWNNGGNWDNGWIDELFDIGQDLSQVLTIPQGQGQLEWFNIQLQIDDALWRAYSTRYYFE